ncbi:MAG: HPr(Ser) kinase/phosphatase [Clostridiales bacterium]|jgi:HPr kinase/phosphorylase|nr:HPr(Ser) kinase/phosphatase [Clostridiales bacterium]MDR2751899.1 HPr(Ser) kinase/phosphatase [Clostridiales bacterium]
MYTVALSEMIKEFNLVLLASNVDTSDSLLTHPDINRPALQLAGFYDYFDADRIQIIGLVEYTYLQKMSVEERCGTLRRLLSHQVSCMVLCRGLAPFPEMIDFAEEFKVPLLGSPDSTTDFMGEVIRWLKVHLAPRITLHGVLVDIYGEGVLIMGESGIGKSETALELIKRGHRFVADDAVEVKRVSHQTLIGSCPELIRYFIELRGIGIIDVKQMFGVESIKATQSIDLIIKLEFWDKKKKYDRLGLREEFLDILGNNIVCHSIPIRPGRNTAIICESAAINHRQKKMGYNAAKILNERVISNMTVE